MKRPICESGPMLDGVKDIIKLTWLCFMLFDGLNGIVMVEIDEIRLRPQVPCRGLRQLRYRNLFFRAIP